MSATVLKNGANDHPLLVVACRSAIARRTLRHLFLSAMSPIVDRGVKATCFL
jgi:hypothetical protein